MVVGKSWYGGSVISSEDIASKTEEREGELSDNGQGEVREWLNVS